MGHRSRNAARSSQRVPLSCNCEAKRVERPLEEQALDPAHYALEEEVRESKREMSHLNSDHMRLSANLQQLENHLALMQKEASDKKRAIELDTECVTKLSIHLVKTSEY